MNILSIRRIRRAAAVVLAATAVGVLGQAAPAQALWFVEQGPFNTVEQCQNARIDLLDSGVVQQCYTRGGLWYFKFAQNF
jgi:hypothetical protein